MIINLKFFRKINLELVKLSVSPCQFCTETNLVHTFPFPKSDVIMLV